MEVNAPLNLYGSNYMWKASDSKYLVGLNDVNE
jgi:hypothetical protein